MKISKNQLRQIIKEELAAVLDEQDAGPLDPKFDPRQGDVTQLPPATARERIKSAGALGHRVPREGRFSNGGYESAEDKLGYEAEQAQTKYAQDIGHEDVPGSDKPLVSKLKPGESITVPTDAASPTGGKAGTYGTMTYTGKK